MEAVGGVPEAAGGSGRRCSDIEFKNMVTVNVIGNDGKTALFTRACMEMIQAARTPSMVITAETAYAVGCVVDELYCGTHPSTPSQYSQSSQSDILASGDG